MEEKERYTIEQFELDEPNCIFDNKTQNVIFTLSGYHYDELSSLMNLLNQQDARIKELEKENQKLCRQIVKFNKENNKLREFRDDILKVQAEPYQFYKENQQLKQLKKTKYAV